MSKLKETSTDQRRVMRAAGLVGTAVFVSRMIGLLRDIVTKNYLGVTTIEATAFDAASRFPETIFLIIAGGAIGSAFIPTFSAYFARDDEAGAWHLFSAVTNLVVIATTVVAIITAVFAEAFVTFFLSEQIGQDVALLPLTVQLMRVMLLSTIIFGASGVVMGALNARQHFLLPAIAPIVYNIGMILGAVLWSPTEMGLAWGAVAGALGHFLVQLPGLRQKRAKYQMVVTIRDPGVQQVLRLMAPRVLGLSFSEVNKFVTLFLSDMMPLGSYPALVVALRIMIMPQGILGQAMGIAAFPTLATLAAKSAYDEMRQILTASLRLLLFLGGPASVLLMMLGQPLIVILFQRGNFGASDTELVAWALRFYAVGLVALTSIEVIARAFYALKDTLTPVLAGGVQLLMMGLLSLWLSNTLFPHLAWHPLGGLALGFTLSNFLEVGILLWLLSRKMGGINGRYLLDGFWRMFVASSLMTLGLWLLQPILSPMNVWLTLISGGVAGGLIYLGASFILRIQELWQFLALGQRLLARLTSKINVP